jgi:3-methyladenine DNA glycosylase AlkD
MTRSTEPERLAAELDRELKGARDRTRAAAAKRYLKSELAFYGVSVPFIRAVLRELRPGYQGLSHAGLLRLVDALWTSPVFECRLAAVLVLDSSASALVAGDMALLGRMLRESKTWALVDELAAAVAGPLFERFPELGGTLDRWAADDDFWLRRSAMLTLLLPLRRGGGDFERFASYADRMLEEREFFIRKAIGWVLRETAKKRPELVYEWIRPRITRASGVTVREAVRWLPQRQRDELLAAYRMRAVRSQQRLENRMKQ